MDGITLLHAGQVAEILNIPVTAVHKEVRAGRLPAVRIGRRIRFEPEKIAIYVQAGGAAIPSKQAVTEEESSASA